MALRASNRFDEMTESRRLEWAAGTLKEMGEENERLAALISTLFFYLRDTQDPKGDGTAYRLAEVLDERFHNHPGRLNELQECLEAMAASNA